MGFHVTDFNHLGLNASAACDAFVTAVNDLNSLDTGVSTAAEKVSKVLGQGFQTFTVKYQSSVDLTAVFKAVEDSFNFVRPAPTDPVGVTPKPAIPKVAPTKPVRPVQQSGDVGL